MNQKLSTGDLFLKIYSYFLIFGRQPFPKVEDVILSHLKLKKSEAESQQLEDESSETQSPTASTTASPTRQAVDSFWDFNDMTEVQFAISRTSFYTYCEAGTGKKIGVKDIKVELQICR